MSRSLSTLCGVTTQVAKHLTRLVILSAAKDLAREWESSQFRNPGPSFRYAPFRMTDQ